MPDEPRALVSCSSCGKKYNVCRLRPGDKFKCTQCGAVNTVLVIKPPKPKPELPPEPLRPEPPLPQPPPPPQPKPVPAPPVQLKKKSAGLPLVWIGLGIIIVVALALIIYPKPGPAKPTPPAPGVITETARATPVLPELPKTPAPQPQTAEKPAPEKPGWDLKAKIERFPKNPENYKIEFCIPNNLSEDNSIEVSVLDSIAARKYPHPRRPQAGDYGLNWASSRPGAAARGAHLSGTSGSDWQSAMVTTSWGGKAGYNCGLLNMPCGDGQKYCAKIFWFRSVAEWTIKPGIGAIELKLNKGDQLRILLLGYNKPAEKENPGQEIVLGTALVQVPE